MTNPTSNIQTYKVVRSLFMIGCTLNIGMTFVPIASIKTFGLFRIEEKAMSNFDAIRLAFQTGQSGLGLLFVIIFAAFIAFLVLAMVQQRRWVFITGASIAAFTVLLEMFSPGNPNIEYLTISSGLFSSLEVRSVGYIATLLMLSGFFAKPPSRYGDHRLNPIV